MRGVISVMPNRKLELHTTRSWDFTGLSKSKVSSSLQGDVIIGLIDTGAWPESESFSDKNMGSPPTKWKGTCQGDGNFTCNNKLIGARWYNSDKIFDEKDFKSPRDSIGHGSHTASTAAGREVPGTSYYGLANGTARGGVPFARIAIYKVCWLTGCSAADILAAFDDAIADGVDVISVSLGAGGPIEYFEDPIAIGSFHAMKKGILTSNSAGNSGPFPLTVSNYAPWSLTVAASTIDRKFVAKAVLGNGLIFDGIVINSFDLHGASFPLIWGGDAANFSAGSDQGISKYCFPESMNSLLVAGKIVFCEAFLDGSGIMLANGVGTIMTDYEIPTDVAFNFPLPVTVISREDGQKVLDYIKTSEYPIATIQYGETWDDSMAPSVVSFSSRGPSPISPDILKPDITAPGVDILAAWSPVSPPSGADLDTRSVNYNIISGTSMSCPHVSGAAAYIKAAHPDWSPAAIKSALMTTATILDPRKHEDREFAYGSGHINPDKALNPGLVYDACAADYINFLCKQGYNATTLSYITGDNSSSCSGVTPGRGWDLNYPSFSVPVEDGQKINAVFTRTVTNVGSANSTYSLIIYTRSSISITVEPASLSFSAVGEKKNFTVTVTGGPITQQQIESGAIMWTDDAQHVVRSPLVIFNYIPDLLSEDSVPEKKPTFKGANMFHKNRFIRRN
ncbi:hypothetical protein UlMin_037097 [Ulmus minor]